MLDCIGPDEQYTMYIYTTGGLLTDNVSSGIIIAAALYTMGN